MAADPLAVVVSRSLALTPDLPLLADPQSRVVVVTAQRHRRGPGELLACGLAARVQQRCVAPDGRAWLARPGRRRARPRLCTGSGNGSAGGSPGPNAQRSAVPVGSAISVWKATTPSSPGLKSS